MFVTCDIFGVSLEKHALKLSMVKLRAEILTALCYSSLSII